MLIHEICELLKKELLNNGYEYGFYLDGRKYRPDMTKSLDEEFYHLLLTAYRIQNPKDTIREKIGTCNDAVVLMKAILDEQDVPCKIWLLHNKNNSKMHTILTFYAENKVVYPELTPQSSKPWYGKEIIYDNEQALLDEYKKNNYEIVDVTEHVIIGEAPEFLLSRLT